jgi:hypothetical protein
MSLTTYSELQTSVANYLGRSDLTSQIPDFITFAELRLQRQLRIRQMVTSTTLTTVSGTATVTLPSDFLEIRDLYVVGRPRQVLTYMSPASFSRNSRADETGKPLDYTINSTTIELAPYPDAAYSLKLLYYKKPVVLSNANTSNEFLVNAPDALLYAALLEAEPYLMNDARLQVWSGFYQNAITSITESDEGAEYSGVPLQIRVAAQ